MKTEPVQKQERPPVLTREEEARRDLGTTVFRGLGRAVLTGGFLLGLAVGLVSFFFGGFHAVRTAFESAGPGGGGGPLDWIPTSGRLHEVEKSLEESSLFAVRLRPRVQQAVTRFFSAGNEQAQPGRDGWLFFRKDLDYVNGKAFLDPAVQRARAARDRVAADPVAAVEDFHKQLEARNIKLILLPVPVKPCIEGHRLGGGPNAAVRARHNASFADFVASLRSRGVGVLDPTDMLVERLKQDGGAQYLQTDTHWTPEAMDAVARMLAREIQAGKASSNGAYERGSQTVEGRGDTQALLGLPPGQSLFGTQKVVTQPVSAGGQVWRPAAEADVLLLGDSFANIYSLGALGWGEESGLAEQLGYHLGRPVDAILRNSDGAFATRQILQRELAAGRDRLQGKRVVVWEFACRELSGGDWKLLSLELGAPKKPEFYAPAAGASVVITGTVGRVSRVPRPGTVPYKEHIACVELLDVRAEGDGTAKQTACLVFTWSMKEQALTPAARLRAGERVEMRVCSWEDVARDREKFQRSELDDAALLAEPVAWSEGVVPPGAKRP
jgi:alginate O-acetyltransferase complex protein AlgJ